MGKQIADDTADGHCFSLQTGMVGKSGVAMERYGRKRETMRSGQGSYKQQVVEGEDFIDPMGTGVEVGVRTFSFLKFIRYTVVIFQRFGKEYNNKRYKA